MDQTKKREDNSANMRELEAVNRKLDRSRALAREVIGSGETICNTSRKQLIELEANLFDCIAFLRLIRQRDVYSSRIEE